MHHNVFDYLSLNFVENLQKSLLFPRHQLHCLHSTLINPSLAANIHDDKINCKIEPSGFKVFSYCIARIFGKGKFGKCGESSAIHQTKTIQISSHNS